MEQKNNNSRSSSQKALDAEFRRTLLVIKPYIPYVNNEYITHYRIWLEKLSDESHKKERNVYLRELKKQIENGVLEEPFRSPPPPGPLPAFRDMLWEVKNRSHHHHNQPNRIPSLPSTARIPVERASFCQQPYSARPDLYHPQYDIQASPGFVYPPTIYPICYTQMPSYAQHEVQYNYEEIKPGRPRRQRKATTLPPTRRRTILELRKSKMQQKNLLETTDDSSWCDLTDISSTSLMLMGGSDTSSGKRMRNERWDRILKEAEVRKEEYENRLSKLVEIIQRLEGENKKLEEKVERAEKDMSLKNATASTSIHNLSGEVECLKDRLQELLEIKSSLQKTNVTNSTEFRGTFSILETELKSTKKINAELRSAVAKMEHKLNEFETTKQKETAALKQKLSKLHSKEIEMLKELHMQQMVKLENSYNQKMVENEHIHSIKVEQLKYTYENRILEMTKNYEEAMTEKNSQIQQLEAAVQQQCIKMEKEVKSIREHLQNKLVGDETQVEKIMLLEKCIAKMDKLFRKTEKEHKKQIAKLRKEIEIREKTNQLLMSSQKVQMTATNSTDKQKEIDAVVNNLERRYKQLLEKMLEQTICTKLKDEKVISELKEKLAELTV